LFGCTTYSKQEGFRSKTVGVRPQTPGRSFGNGPKNTLKKEGYRERNLPVCL
jgi:hypothetical protein